MPVSLTVSCGINQFFSLRANITILQLVIGKMFLLEGVRPLVQTAITDDGRIEKIRYNKIYTGLLHKNLIIEYFLIYQYYKTSSSQLIGNALFKA